LRIDRRDVAACRDLRSRVPGLRLPQQAWLWPKGQPALRVCRPYAIPRDRPTRHLLLRSCITQLVLSCNGAPKKNPGPRPGHRGVPWGQNEWDADPKVRTLPWFRKLQNEKLCYSIQPSYSNEMQEL
jgi:hypothetical protein